MKSGEIPTLDTITEEIDWIPPDPTLCTWEFDMSEDTWYTECDEFYEAESITNLKHCPFCGRVLQVSTDD